MGCISSNGYFLILIFAQTSYSEDKFTKTSGNSLGNVGILWGVFWFLGYFQNLIFFYFLNLKKYSVPEICYVFLLSKFSPTFRVCITILNYLLT
jgi:hypothetical protein